MKTGKEIKITNFKDYNVIFGSVNNKNPKAIYINISSWAEPKQKDNLNYNFNIRNINKKLKQLLFNNLSLENNLLFDKNRTIVDLDIRESGIRYGKKSFMNCEITLYLYNQHSITSSYIRNTLEELTNDIITNTFENSDIFNFNRKKK